MDRNIDNNVDNNIIQTEYSELMQKSYIDYAMSVIIARALPDVRDGLKPVQRRTLYDMHELGIRYDKPYRKSARIVGDTMGKYHPHGDSSIYDAMVVLAQDFKKGMPLIDGHGNFGSIEGDGAAAMRYTEARLQKITQEAYLADLDKNVVDFIPNYDETGSNEHFTLGPGCILTGVAASFAALGLVYKALRFIKLLLAGSENEFLATLFADESLVFVHVFYLA